MRNHDNDHDKDEKQSFLSGTVIKDNNVGENFKTRHAKTGWGNIIHTSLLALGIAGVGFSLAEFMSYNAAVYHETGDLAGETGWAPAANYLGANDPVLAAILALTTCFMLHAVYCWYKSVSAEEANKNSIIKGKQDVSQFKTPMYGSLQCASALVFLAALYGSSALLSGTLGSPFSEISDIGVLSDANWAEKTAATVLFGGMGVMGMVFGYHTTVWKGDEISTRYNSQVI